MLHFPSLAAAVTINPLYPISIPTSAPAATAPATDPSVANTLSSTFSFLDQLRLNDLIASNHFFNWLVLLIAIAAGLTVGRLLAYALTRIAKHRETHGWHSQAELFYGLASPLSLASFTTGLMLGLAQISMADSLQSFSVRIITLLYLLAIFWTAFNLVSVIEVALFKVTKTADTPLHNQLVPVIRKSLRIFIVVIGILFILQNVFHRDIGAWLTGLGIAGLAVSLSAQDSLKNLFGSITILFDQPFTIGDEIKYAGYDGNVEEIGFRSTKIRTADGSLVNIPNSAIVNNPVDNWGVRSTQRRFLQLHLPLNTPSEKIKRALQIIKDLLESENLRKPIHDTDPKRNADPPQVFFNDFNPDSLNLQIFYWYRSMDGWAFSAHAQSFNLQLLEAFAKEQIQISPPTQSLNLTTPPTPSNPPANKVS